MNQITKLPGRLMAFGLLLVACNNSIKDHISDELFAFLKNNCHTNERKNVVVYYFDGDCSFCIGQVIELEERYKKNKDTTAINIAKTRNPAYLRFQLKEENISPCIIVTADSTKYDSLVRTRFEFNKMYVVDKDNGITPFKLN